MNRLPHLRQWIGLMALCVLAMSSATADEIGGSALYEARVAVEDRSAESRRGGIREAGIVVLSRISGERKPEEHPELSAIVDRLQGLVSRYSIETDDDDGLVLRVRFDADAMDREVREAGHALWGRERPRTLVWLAMRDGGDRRLVRGDDGSGVLAELTETAQRRGLPLLFPLMDLEDRAKVDFADIWGGFDDQVLEASARYNANAILIGRLERSGSNAWSGRWTLYQPDGAVRWRGSPEPRRQALAEGLHETADRMALRFAVDGGPDGGAGLKLRVRGLNELEDYVAVERYLQSLTPVEQLRLESLERDTAIFLIQSRGGLRTLEQAIELGDRLVRAESGEQATELRGTLVEMSPAEALPTYRLR
jgi:uncharacterized protein